MPTIPNYSEQISLARELIREVPSREALAKRVGVSVRTLHRILTEENYGMAARILQKLLEEGMLLREELARKAQAQVAVTGRLPAKGEVK